MVPQIIMIAFIFIGLGIDAAKHQQPRTGNYNFGASIVGALINIGLLAWGGFFNCFLK